MRAARGGVHLGAVLPHVGTPIAVLAFWLMHRADLLGPAPFWFILVLLLGSGVAGTGPRTA